MVYGAKTIWYTASVKPHFGWPTSEFELNFQGHKYLLRPETKELLPTVSILCEYGVEFDEGATLINKFLSSLSWAENSGACVLSVIGRTGEKPMDIGKGSLRHTAEPKARMYLPMPKNPKAVLALAIYREAMCVNSIPYKFLGYFKIINILFSDGASQKTWINNNLYKIDDFKAKERLICLTDDNGVSDIGEYLYHQGRCAIAHAFSGNIVDPDLAGESRRLNEDMPLIKALAMLIINKELGVMTQYELIDSIRHARSIDEFPEDYVQTSYL